MKIKFTVLAAAAVLLLTSAVTTSYVERSQYEYGAPPAKVLDSVLPGGPADGAVAEVPNLAPLSDSRDVNVRLDVVHTVREIAEGKKVLQWTFGGSVPGPTIHVRQGDRVHFTMSNRSNEPAEVTMPMPHSIDFHAAMVNPSDKFKTIAPGQSIQFEFTANYPGVFMYHCGTPMLIHHMAMGMYGAVVVEPKDGYPTHADREYVLVQSEFYPTAHPQANGLYGIDMEALMAKRPSVVAFNGRANRYMTSPLVAKPGERVRLYVLNVGPNDTSSFHIVGTIMDRVWLDGNPANETRGRQTVLLGSSSSAIVEFVVPEAGNYFFVDHEFADATMGAIGEIHAE